MLYRILADITVAVHLLWVLFLVSGAAWGRRSRRVRAVHLGGLAFAALLQIFGWYCPLTHLEFWLRQQHEPSLTYAGSFLIHYAEQVLYLDVSAGVLALLTAVLVLANGALYGWMFRSRRGRRGGSSGRAGDHRGS